ncbi:MAG: sensor histidine kinase [Microbacterium sp.]
MTTSDGAGATTWPERAVGADGDEQIRDPWGRFSWILGIVWIAFMAFPIASAFRADVDPPWRVTAIVLLLLYSAVYIVTFVRMLRTDDWTQAQRRAYPALVVMAALMLLAAALVGPGALGAGSFLVAIAMFAGERRRAVIQSIAILLAQYLLLTVWLSVVTAGFEGYAILYMPPAIVFVTTGSVRLIDGAQDAHNEILRQSAVVAERERVARDVHDVLGHSLTIVTVKAELAERVVDSDPERAKDELAQIRSLTREALGEVRATVAGLRVARLGDELASAAAALRDAGVEADVPSEPEVVDPRYRIVVAWALREAVTNVVRHAEAGRCAIRLSEDGVVIEDDGRGTPSDVAARGLRGIRERVEAAGAALTVGPGLAGDGRGTRVEVRW